MKYKRLTDANRNGDNYIIQELEREPGSDSVVPQFLLDCYYRLAELEDRIDDGTIADLQKPFIDVWDVVNEDFRLYTRYDVWHYDVATHRNIIENFYDKELAEARLKELY